MRPITLQPTPKDKDGNKITVNTYQDWRDDLLKAYGPHCAYCNIRISGGPKPVDHIVAQVNSEVDPLDFSNLVLACSNCNTYKSDKEYNHTNHYLPTYHNTHIIFEYTVRFHSIYTKRAACIPVPSTQLDEVQKAKAQTVIRIFKLDQVEREAGDDDAHRDDRWLNRHLVYEAAQHQKRLWNVLTEENQRLAYIDCLKQTVNANGFFSIWYKEFEDIPRLLQVILEAFPNTALEAFDSQNGHLPIDRPNFPI